MLPEIVKGNHAREIANSAWIRIGIITIVTLTGAVWLYIKGPIPVIKGSTPLTEMVPFWYMLSAFPILGMLISDLITYLFTFKFQAKTFELFIQITLLTLLSNIRLSLFIPLSGHTLLLGYFILRRVLIDFRTSNINKIEILIAFIILLAASYMKLLRWSDPLTYLAGLGLGAILALVSSLFWRSQRQLR